jgi:hypothetical protein|tara:strand:+ start:17 stop:706 length:690 start_codon:yes stop_codon:yes gene_type:complete
MKKTLLTERFQQLAGIKPLYPTHNQLNEGFVSNLMDKVKDFGVNSMEKIKSVVGSAVSPVAKDKEKELETMVSNNPELTQDLGTLEDLQNNIDTFLKNYKVGVDSDIKENKGGVMDITGKFATAFGALSAAGLTAVGGFGFGKVETLSYMSQAKNYLAKGLDYFDITSGAIEQTLPNVEFLYGSPQFYAYMLAASVAIKVITTVIKNKQTNENVGVDTDLIINMHLFNI